MKRNLLFSLSALLAVSLFAADAGPKDDITAAAKKLGEAANYSWKTTVVVPESSQFKPGPTEGKIEKDGYTHVTSSFGGNESHTVIKGEKIALTNREGEWQSAADLEGAEGRGRFRLAMARNLKPPAKQVADLVAATKELKKDGDTYSGELNKEGAEALLRFGPTGSASGAKGTVKFWLKEGALVKYEFKVQGSVSFNGNDMEVDRATTVEIKDIGTTKVNVPEGAKKKLT
jgi:hypothetical protein